MTTIYTGTTTTSAMVIDTDISGNLIVKTGGSGGATAITVDGDQIATFANPLIEPVPVFEARPSATQTLTSNTFTLLNFDTVVYDTHSWYDTTNKRYMPQIAGYYVFSSGHTISGTGITAQIQALYKNGALERYLQFNRFTSTGGSVTASGSIMVYMNGTTDYVQSYSYPLATTVTMNSTVVSQQWFQGYLLRRT